MKKLFIIIGLVLTMATNAFAVVVPAHPIPVHNDSQTISNHKGNLLIGKVINGCKIVDTYIDDYNYGIVCVKDGKLYKSSVYMARLKDVEEEDIVKLMEE